MTTEIGNLKEYIDSSSYNYVFKMEEERHRWA